MSASSADPGIDRFEKWMRAIWSTIRDGVEMERGEGSFRLYKKYEPEKFRRILLNVIVAERYQNLWESAITLLSGGIFEHPFENANHRTFLTATQLYLHENGVDLPQEGRMRFWKRTANSYIRKSKTIRLELSEVAYPSDDLIDRVGEKHEAMTRSWLKDQLRGQSKRLELTPAVLLRNLI